MFVLTSLSLSLSGKRHSVYNAWCHILASSTVKGLSWNLLYMINTHVQYNMLECITLKTCFQRELLLNKNAELSLRLFNVNHYDTAGKTS